MKNNSVMKINLFNNKHQQTDQLENRNIELKKNLNLENFDKNKLKSNWKTLIQLAVEKQNDKNIKPIHNQGQQ